MSAGEAIAERRLRSERRGFSWRTVVFGFLHSRRRGARREDDAEVVFVDWHHPWLFFLAVGIMILSCMDAFFTLMLLQQGMIEVNPVMAAVLGQSTELFAISKVAMTGTGILILVFLAKFHFMNRVRTGIFLTAFFSLYCCLICYQFVNVLAGL